jgi:hypothetical protein
VGKGIVRKGIVNELIAVGFPSTRSMAVSASRRDGLFHWRGRIFIFIGVDEYSSRMSWKSLHRSRGAGASELCVSDVPPE